jgi:DnaJ family protein C protein 28
MSSDRFRRAIDKQLEEARQAGKFDNLPGKGKPLKLDKNPFEDPEWSTAYKLLKDNAFTLPWIAAGQQIDQELEDARARLRQAWRWYREQLEAPDGAAWSGEEWARAEQVFRGAITAINQKISDYNLIIPNMRFEKFKLNAAREIEKIKDAQ